MNKTLKLTSIPTPIRKKGINSAFPTNPILFISGEEWGMKLFNKSPAKNAPMIASMPAASARNDARKTIANTKMYCETLLIALKKPSYNYRKNKKNNAYEKS